MNHFDKIRLIDEMKTRLTILDNEPKYKFSRSKWYIADFEEKYYWEVEAWCTEHFGPQDKFPGAWSRWQHMYESQIHFRDEKDYAWFVLRWS
jgi:hypothetical protein